MIGCTLLFPEKMPFYRFCRAMKQQKRLTSPSFLKIYL